MMTRIVITTMMVDRLVEVRRKIIIYFATAVFLIAVAFFIVGIISLVSSWINYDLFSILGTLAVFVLFVIFLTERFYKILSKS